MSALIRLPVVVCGQLEHIARTVTEALKPEYEVIHVVLSKAAGCQQLPLILAGKEAPSELLLGSKDYSKPPIAIILGSAYGDADVLDMMRACEKPGLKKVPWLRPDASKPKPPLGPEYGKAMVVRVKDKMAQLRETNRMASGEVEWY